MKNQTPPAPAETDNRLGSTASLGSFAFGDRVYNPHASRDNPNKHGIFVRKVVVRGRINPGTWYECTDGKGKFWMSAEIRHEPDAGEVMYRSIHPDGC